MTFRLKRQLSAALVCLFTTSAAHAAWITTDLGALDQIVGFNMNGTVSGNYWSDTPFGYRPSATFFDSKGARTVASGGFGTTLYAINQAGLAVGQIEVRRGVLGGDPGSRHAFIYNDGKIVDVGTLGGYASVAVAVSGSGVAVGTSMTSSGDQHAFKVTTAGMFDLGTLGGRYSSAQAINDAGQIAGVSNDAYGNMYAFLSDGYNMRALGATTGNSESVRGSVVALTNSGLVVMANGQLFDTTKNGAGIQTGATFTDANEAGEIVGSMNFAGEAGYRAVVYRDGVYTNLGVLDGGMYSGATDVNSRGQVVGFSHLGSGQYHSFLYTNGRMQDIADLITGFTNVIPGEVMLNDAGQIAGIGMIGGRYHAFVLTEEFAYDVPEPGTLAMSVLGLAGLARLRRRARKT